MFRKTIEMMFEFSEQAVLVLDAAVISYANPRTKKLLSVDPTGEMLTALTDHKFVQACFSHKTEPVTYHKNVWFGDRCFHVSRTAFHGMTVLFLHLREDARFPEFFLHDTVRALLAQIRTLPDSKQTREMERLATATLAVASPRGTVTDLRAFLAHTLSPLDCLSDSNRFRIELDERETPVFLYAELMYFTLLWMVLELLKTAGPEGALVFSYECRQNAARITLRTEAALSPEARDTFRKSLTAKPDDLNAQTTALFRARRVFSLHNSELQYTESETCFTVFAEIPLFDYPPTLYAPIADFFQPISLDADEIRSLILGYLEEA